MLSSYNAAPFKLFHPFPKSPAKLLTQFLPAKAKANCLLLSCSNPWDILYTVCQEHLTYANRKRDLDFTCCDEEPAGLARNILKFSIIIDYCNRKEDAPVNFDSCLFIAKDDLDTITTQAAKLIALSESMKKWESGTYGDIISFCDSESLKAVRHCWLQYAKAGSSNLKRRKEFIQRISKQPDTDLLDFGRINLTSSYGALALPSTDAAARYNAQYWKRETSPDAHHCHVNPLFACSSEAGSKFTFSASSNEFTAFHLASSLPEAHLTLDSPYHDVMHIARHNSLPEIAMLALAQSEGWTKSFQQFVRDSRAGKCSLRIRIFVGDPCAFCFALDRRRLNTFSNGLACYIQPFTGTMLNLDGNCDSRGKKYRAPSTFNVVDASDLIDTVGLLNILISVIPILDESPASAVFTDTTFFAGTPEDKESELLPALLNGDVGNICSMLGIAPLSYVTGIATGDQHEYPVFPEYGIANRIVWKYSLSGDSSAAASYAKPSCSTDDLSDMLLQAYLRMFPYDENDYCQEKVARAEAIGKHLYHPPQYTRRSFAAFLAFLQPRISVDWSAMINLLLDKVRAKSDITRNLSCLNLQDLYLNLHLFGVHTTEQLSPRTPIGQAIDINTQVGSITWVIVTVPRFILNNLQKPFDRLKGHLHVAFQLQLVNLTTTTTTASETDHIFSSTIPLFGKLAAIDKKFHRDVDGWNGSSDLNICAQVPTHLLLHPEGAYRAINIVVRMMRETSTILAFSNTDIINGELFSASLSNRESVHLFNSFPGVTVPNPCPLPSHNSTIAQITGELEVSYPIIDFSSRNFTTRIAFTQKKEKQNLSDDLNVNIRADSPCTAILTMGSIKHRCTFPFPIGNSLNLRRSKKRGWIEVIATMSSPSEKGGYFTNPFPVLSVNGQRCNWNFSFIHFGTVPKLEFKGKHTAGWMKQHLMTMYSNDELQHINTDSVSLRPMTSYKKSIQTIFMRLVSTKDRVFDIRATSTSAPSFLLFFTGLFLDDNGRTVLAEAYVLALPLVNNSLRSVLDNVLLQSVKLVVGTEGTTLWKSAIVGMVERCCDFQHRRACRLFPQMNAPTTKQEAAIGCGCQTLGPELLSSPCRHFVDALTRVVVSPVFVPPFVEESRAWVKGSWASHITSVEERDGAGTTQCSWDGCTNEGTKMCDRCKKVKYCSRACQVAHWKKVHKVQCLKTGSTSASLNSSALQPPHNVANPSPAPQRTILRLPLSFIESNLMENNSI